jgi:hypothetical protein
VSLIILGEECGTSIPSQQKNCRRTRVATNLRLNWAYAVLSKLDDSQDRQIAHTGSWSATVLIEGNGRTVSALQLWGVGLKRDIPLEGTF